MNIVMRSKMLVAVIVQFILKLFTSTEVVAQPVDLSTDGWKFKDSDNISWASPQYDDTQWANISVGKTWEAHFDKAFDGIAWYRRTVTISKNLEKAAKKSGAMILKLGMIDDADETYFNGVKIGETGKFPPESVTAFDVPRNYTVPYNLIKWDAPNVIAVRVADWGGGGGLYAGEYALEPISWKNKFKFIIEYGESSNAFGLGKPVVIKPQFLNNSEDDLKGVLTCEIKKFTGEIVETKQQDVKIPANGAGGLRASTNKADDFTFDIKDIGFYVAHFSFKDKNGYCVKDKKGFAVAPESFKPTLTRPADFDDYWSRAKEELMNVSPDYRLIPLPKRSNDKVEVFEVEFYSLGGVRVRGYYTRPRAKVNVPALLHVQGYSSVMEPWALDEQMAAFFLNIRGHGNSKQDVNPGFPGYLQSGIENKENYIYRGAYMDCVRAIDFLCNQPEVDTTRVAVEGGSQGGALSVATASLDKRIKFCMPDVPFLSNFRLYFDIAQWPSNEFKSLNRKGKSWDDIYGVLDYIDVMNHAPNITVPVYMAVGLFDDICPPAINFSMYNNLGSTEKSYMLYPQAGHALPSEHYDKKMAWLRPRFGLLP
jgi:cephalosporin-C deacetylase